MFSRYKDDFLVRFTLQWNRTVYCIEMSDKSPLYNFNNTTKAKKVV